MPSHVIHDLWTAATDADARHAAEFELSLLRDVLKMLPAGVTVQDQHGDFLLINDAAASQLGIGGNSREWTKACHADAILDNLLVLLCYK